MPAPTNHDAEPARQIIETLRNAGWTVQSIARASGVNAGDLSTIATGKQTRIRRSTLERISVLDLTAPPPPRLKSGPTPRVHTVESARPRFLASIVSMNPGQCWPWGGKHWKGYGKFFYGYRHHQAHRVSYELFVGPIPEGLELDHLCRNPPCVNPEHLEPVTPLENQRRRAAAQTHCHEGHPFDEANTYVRPSKTGGVLRGCRRCGRAAVARYAERRRSAS